MKKIFTLVLAAAFTAVIAQADDATPAFTLDVTPANGEVEVVNSIRISSSAKPVFGINPNSTKSISLSLKGDATPLMLWNANAVQSAVVVEADSVAAATIIELTADNVTPDPTDSDFGGNASDEDNFGVSTDEQDPDFGGNASDEDNYGFEGEDPADDDFGGNASDEDNFGVSTDDQDPDFGGNASDEDIFGTVSEEDESNATPDEEFGGFAGDDGFGIEGDDDDFGGNASDEDDNGVSSDEQDPTYGGNDADSDGDFGYQPEDPDSEFGGFGGDDAFGMKPVIGKSGEYSMVIPAGMFVADNVENEEITIEWTATIAGITNIKINGKAIEGIYDLKGNRVSNPSHGIFIINGIKTLVR